jgi:hypothetical protein
MIMEIIQHTKNESFESLKKQSEYDSQALGTFGNGGAPLGHNESFNQAKFNQIFQDHRMWNPEDDGYGDRMIPSEHDQKSLDERIAQRERDFLSSSSSSMMTGVEDTNLLHKFDPRNFNTAFERRAAHDTSGDRSSTAMVVRTEPEEMTMLRNMGSRCSSLSVEKVDDFSSPFLGGGAGVGGGGGTGYTDYMRAFSKDALITPHVADVGGHGYRTVKELEAERSNLSFIPSAELLQARAHHEAAVKEQDEMRWRNYMKHQEAIEAHQQSIRNVLSDTSATIETRRK